MWDILKKEYKVGIYCCFVLCYLPKSKRGMVLAFSADFLYMFFIKMFLTKYHNSWPIFCIKPNFLKKITNRVFSNSFLANWSRDKLYNLVSSSSPALTDKSKKREGNNAENYVNYYVWFPIYNHGSSYYYYCYIYIIVIEVSCMHLFLCAIYQN